MSYRYVWNYLHDIQETLEEPIVETYKGGKAGGGGARLTDLGRVCLVSIGRLRVILDRFYRIQAVWR